MSLGRLSRLRCLPVLLLWITSLLASRPISAQFNGPADTAKDTVNAPHVITTDPAILYPPVHDVHIHASDTVRVTIYGFPDYATQDRVSQEGYVTLPLIDPARVIDLTPKEAQQLIGAQLEAAGMFHKPQVRVEILESPASIITVMGETHGTITVLSGSKKLFDVLAAVGGLPTTVSHVISIDRPGLSQSINVDLGTDPELSKYANIPVFTGDTITTARIGSVYLLGALKSPAAIPLNSTAPLTMLQVLATAGGSQYEAELDKVHLIRTVGTQRTMVMVDLKSVRAGHLPDPVLQADDIVFVPSNFWKASIRNGGATTIFGIALTFVSLLRY